MATEERKIIYRKSGQLLEIGFTTDQIDSIFKGGYLPFKLRGTIRNLDTAPDLTATADLVTALQSHARQGTVQALAELLEPDHNALTDELLADLQLAQNNLLMDEPTADEMATLVHRQYGGSRKLGPVDQRALRELLADRVVVRRRASQRQLSRFIAAMQAERGHSLQRDAEVRGLALRLVEYMREQRIRQTIPADADVLSARATGQGHQVQNDDSGELPQEEEEEDLTPEKTYQDLSHLLEDVFAYIRETLADADRLADEKRRLFAILEQTEQRRFLEKEPLHSVVVRVLEKPQQELKVQEHKLRAIEDRMSDLQVALTKAKRERPVTVATKVDTDHHVREKLQETEEKNRSLEAKERALRAELQQLRQETGGQRQKFGFVAASRTIKLIKRRERDRRKAKKQAEAASRDVKAEGQEEAEEDYMPSPETAELYSRQARYRRRSRSEENMFTPRYVKYASDGNNSDGAEGYY